MRLSKIFSGFAVASVVVVSATLLWPTFGQDSFEGSPLLKPNDRSLVASGRSIYAENCASCHGAQLEGQPNWRSPNANGRLPAPPHDETGHTWHHSDQILFDITKFGVAKAAGLSNYTSDMPAYEEILTDEEIVAVLSWIKAQWPNEISDKHDRLNRTADKDTK